ncbi:hypothetical protein CVU76_02930 [Candidatus Dojkabacteria bacterium HGW-Dojkabacteria-1]|uniref:Pili assembly chaperone n=1 Tax=Candidatus Dojkabacteria bacterium HGW-Dojkabacteria-1 TaxID=2013761 RepID=A0A2N2F413_9BACT|nr:MAG: hypothetical protein CVU76_02930 [Candidatus Dojkabacteria bacterium HGW-Dojkabacteria-1]
MVRDQRKYQGFSLIEILVVVALIIILATITLVAINPGKNFRDTRNAQRSADVTQILNAVTQYTSEEGNSVAGLSALAGTIATCDSANAYAGTEIGTGTGMVNLSTVLVDEFIVAIPRDPSRAASAEGTGYNICVTTGGRVQVSAPLRENNKEIVVKR